MRPAIGVLERYTTEFLPWLTVQRRWPRITLALLFGCFAAAVAFGWAMLFVEGVPLWGFVVLLFASLLSGVMAWEALTTLRRSFHEQVLGALLREAWPQALVDVHGRLGDETVQRAGFFLLMQRREFHGLVRLRAGGLPVALCVGEAYRVHERDDNRRDERLFCGTLFELGAVLPLSAPVVIAMRTVSERPVPPGSAAFTEQRLGDADFDALFAIWAASANAVREAIPAGLASRLVDIARRLPPGGALRLTLDGEGVRGALDGRTASSQIYPYGALPGADDLIAEVARIATVCEIAEACAQTLRPQPRELSDFAGDFRPAAGTRSGAARLPDEDAATALALLRTAGITLADRGSYVMVDFAVRRTGWMLAVSLVLAAGLAWVLLDLHAVGWSPGAPVTVAAASAWLISLPGAEPTLAWLLAWHPWSTLLAAATPLPLLWQWAVQEPRTLRASAAGIHTVRGLAGRAAELPVRDASALRVEAGRVYLDAHAISPNLPPATAVALARLLAPQLGCALSIPDAGR